MATFFVFAIGFLAQILFSARLLLQWVQSEWMKKVLTPVLFWKLSLIASFLLFVYGWLRADLAIVLGQSLTYFIYIRNMQLQKTWGKIPLLLRVFLFIFPLIIVGYLYLNNQLDLHLLFNNKDIPRLLMYWGIFGQITFTLRFIYQWIISERNKESLLPLGFWILSVVGSLMILIYAVLRKDPVLFVGQIFGFVVYIRNIVLCVKYPR